MANVLHVLEIVHRVRPDARVHVNWRLVGKEAGFRYGNVGENVWRGLFATLYPAPLPGRVYRASHILDYALWGNGKDYLRGKALDRQRTNYHRTICRYIEVVNPRIREEISNIETDFFRGKFCIGVHRRVGNPLVVNLQYDGAVPSLDRLIECVHSKARSSGAQDWIIYLATDDAEAVSVFSNAFGSRVLVREQVQRTTPREVEVHFQSWGKLSLADAEDVVIDALLLSRCAVLIHASSSVSTLASLMNPTLVLMRAGRDD